MTFTREPAGNSFLSGGSRRHVGELVVRRLSRGSLVVVGVIPYKSFLLVVMSGLQQFVVLSTVFIAVNQHKD